MQIVIQKWGNSAGIRIPLKVMKAAHLTLNSQVDIREEAGTIIIQPMTATKYTLEQLLAGSAADAFELTDEDREWLNATPAGKEVW